MGWKSGGDGGLDASQEQLLKYLKYNADTNQIEAAREVQTTLNSFFLGNQHKMSSGAENVFFTNLESNVDWFPAWSGIKDQSQAGNQAETGVVPPSFRTYGDLFEIEPSGAAQGAGNSVPYTAITSLLGNHSVFGQRFIVDEPIAVDDFLFYKVFYGTDTTGIQAYEQVFTGTAYNVGDTVDWWFSHPIEGHVGTPIFVNITRRAGSQDGDETDLIVRESVTAGVHYSNIRIREFFDKDVQAGVTFLNGSDTIRHAGAYAIDTSSGVVTLTVNAAVGYKSFTVFDADQNFNQNSCIVDFGGAQGTAVLQTKNDSYLFYWDGTQWRFLDLNTKNGGIV